MLKVMVVDDENIVIDSIRYIVSKNFDNVLVAESARSGREAIEKAEAVKPDLVFMDIKMPGINGIDAIKEIKSIYPQVQFVIISACEQFEFAKEAVSLGVIEYLMKPVNRTKIIEIIRRAEREIAEFREKKNRELELKEKFERVLPVLEHGFIYSILLYEDYNQEIDNYRRILDLSGDAGYIMTIEFGEQRDSGEFGNVIGSSVLSQSFYPQLRDIVKSRFSCVIGPVMLNRVIIYVPVPARSDNYTERCEAVAAAEYIIEKISERVNVQFRIGIGSVKNSSESILSSFSESLGAIRQAKVREIIHINDIPDEYRKSQSRSNYKEKLLIDKAAMGETGECLSIFNEIFDELMPDGQSSIEDMKNNLLELVVVLHRLALDYEIDGRDALKNQIYLKEFLAFNEPIILKNWCKSQIESITAGIRAARDKRCNHLVSVAKDYIDKNYCNDLTLEDVSRETGLSPHYFSRFFKEETGENFIDYLTRVRIKVAKELLEEKLLSVKEICFKVGYNDPNYFSRIFKRITGFSPSDYKG